MLAPAICYKQELIEKYNKTWFNPKYFYFHYGYGSGLNISKNNCWSHQFVSLSNITNEVIGYIFYDISPNSHKAYNLAIVSFNDIPNFEFGKDVKQAVEDIFLKYNFNKLTFSVIQGNPAEKSYDNFIKKYNGKIVRILKYEIELQDNKLYNEKLYEIFKNDFIKSMKG